MRFALCLSLTLFAVALPWPAAAAGVLAFAVPARMDAAAANASPSRKASKPKKARRAKQTPPVVQPERMPSGETVTDRERRLARECKGRPNAGACAGHTDSR